MSTQHPGSPRSCTRFIVALLTLVAGLLLVVTAGPPVAPSQSAAAPVCQHVAGDRAGAWRADAFTGGDHVRVYRF